MFCVAGGVSCMLQEQSAVFGALGVLAPQESFALFGSYVVDKAFLRLEVKAHYVAVVLFRTLRVNGKPFPFTCRILHTVGMYHRTVEVHFYAFGLQLHVFVFNVAFTV